MPFIEAPTTFYLGRRVDPSSKKVTDDVIYYDSRDLTTHAVVVGMTGSGKTGLCIAMLEEAILDNIPAIIIDPKGDITNLLLTFPELRPEDFRPWVNEDDALRSGMDINAYSADVAKRWRDGLGSWGISSERLKWLKMATQMSIYTPGSDAGLPVSILASLRYPREGWAGNEEGIREKLTGITTALLALAGINAQPVKDAEHVLVSNIIEHAWRQNQDLTLEDIITQVQQPPFDKLGVLPINKFMTERKRFTLAMELNNIIASPSFRDSWLQGQSLDMQSLLYQPNGRARVSIFYTAHLNDAERMFINTLILENMLSWMRTLSGTTTLRAILYIDEMFGYFPPYPRNPPTKDPILRLLKQARAFGIGLILATQNPGDLDYKGLTNAGTWFIGRLQSDNDRAKVMDGLRELATAEDGLNLRDVENMIADIPPRVFLMRNVHDDEGAQLVHTRWVMNYLRGPLTRQQIGQLMHAQRQQLLGQVAQQMGGHPQQTQWQQQAGIQSQYTGQVTHGLPPTLPGLPAGAPMPPTTLPGMPAGLPAHPPQNAPYQAQSAIQPAQPQGLSNAPQGFNAVQPAITASIAQYFVPPRINSQQAFAHWQQNTRMMNAQPSGQMQIVYEPMLLAQAVVRYQDRKAGVYSARVFAYAVPDVRLAGLIQWEDHIIEPINARDVSSTPIPNTLFGDIPAGLMDRSRLTALRTEITDMLYNTAMLVVPFNPDLKVYGSPDNEFSQFQAQIQLSAREKRDAEMDKLSEQYAQIIQKLEANLNKQERQLEANQKELRDRQREELFTTGEALLSLWKGRTNYTLSRMSRATRYRRQTNADIGGGRDTIGDIEREIGEKEREFEEKLQQINDKWVRIAQNTQEHVINPLKKDIQLELFGVGWLPLWYVIVNGQPVTIPAV
jgi:hypothetical protein